jgi:hypothetical protein
LEGTWSDGSRIVQDDSSGRKDFERQKEAGRLQESDAVEVQLRLEFQGISGSFEKMAAEKGLGGCRRSEGCWRASEMELSR